MEKVQEEMEASLSISLGQWALQSSHCSLVI